MNTRPHLENSSGRESRQVRRDREASPKAYQKIRRGQSDKGIRPTWPSPIGFQQFRRDTALRLGTVGIATASFTAPGLAAKLPGTRARIYS